jgi:hypothetical protein
VRASTRRNFRGRYLVAAFHRFEEAETIAEYDKRTGGDRTEISDHAAEKSVQFVLVKLRHRHFPPRRCSAVKPLITQRALCNLTLHFA